MYVYIYDILLCYVACVRFSSKMKVTDTRNGMVMPAYVRQGDQSPPD